MESIKDQMDLGIMDIKEAEFYATEGGFVGLKYKNEEYKHVVLRRIMPMQQPWSYISVADHENKEIGILQSVDDLPDMQKAVVVTELDNRYYSPEILDVVSVQDKLGYVYMEMQLKNKRGIEYKKNCAIKDVSRNIRMLSDNSIIIFDVDGNRYIASDLKKLSRQSMRKLDAYLF
ncbi:MAG: DUF1854 domain-containing protein [Defluviitaleaceae bacterium]|nr:DUF1854 domain-containing protein [Defluviitaleaceae bacterium]